MFTGKFTQKTQVLWKLWKHSQGELISQRTSHACVLRMSRISFPNGIRRHTLSSCYSTMTCEVKHSMIACNDKPTSASNPERPYQVVVAATRDMGIGKDGTLPWDLPGDLRYFKEVTTSTFTAGKRNAVIMGRKTWESIPQKYRPLPNRLNVVLTRSGKLEAPSSEDLVMCGDLPTALKLLGEYPHSSSLEKVFVIGGGQVLKEALNGPGCEAIHLTDIETNFDCDTFIPRIDLSMFDKWCSTGPIVENNVRFSFMTYVRAKVSAEQSSENGIKCDTTTVPEGLCSEFNHLKQVQELIASGGTRK